MKSVSFKTSKYTDEKEEEPDVECLDCRFSCNEENELETHKKTVHEKVYNEHKQKEGNLLTLQSNINVMIRENSKLNRAHYENTTFLNAMKAREKEYIETIETMKTQVKTVLDKKRKCGRVISGSLQSHNTTAENNHRTK